MTRVTKEEFEKTVDDYSDILYRCAYTYCSNRADAEDAVQETFIKYLNKSPAFRDERHKKAWLLRVAINTARDIMRSNRRRNEAPLDENTPDEKDSLSACEIWAAVAQLPPKYRIVVEMYYREGLSIEEIAAALGKGRSTVGDRLTRARKMLKEMYDREG